MTADVRSFAPDMLQGALGAWVRQSPGAAVAVLEFLRRYSKEAYADATLEIASGGKIRLAVDIDASGTTRLVVKLLRRKGSDGQNAKLVVRGLSSPGD